MDAAATASAEAAGDAAAAASVTDAVATASALAEGVPAASLDVEVEDIAVGLTNSPVPVPSAMPALRLGLIPVKFHAQIREPLETDGWHLRRDKNLGKGSFGSVCMATRPPPCRQPQSKFKAHMRPCWSWRPSAQ